MAQIVRRQLEDILDRLSPVTRLESGRDSPFPEDELFLCALGFEPRCLTVPDRLSDAGYGAGRALYFRYGTNLDDNAANLTKLEHDLRQISPIVEPLDVDASDFPALLRAQMDLVVREAAPEIARVTFDISVAANRLLLRCMKVLLEYNVSLRILYSEAQVYHPTKEEYDREPGQLDSGRVSLEHGVGDVLPSIDHPGQALDPLPDFVVLFPSFKPERSRAVLSFVDPSLLPNPGGSVVWLVGRPHLDEDSWRREAMRELNEIGPDSPQYEVSTFEYKDTLKVLERLHSERSETHTITLSPLGSKLQAFGTALFCFMRPDVRVIFSTPKEYNAVQYSAGCKAVWQIDLGSLDQLRSLLMEVGTIKIVDDDHELADPAST